MEQISLSHLPATRQTWRKTITVREILSQIMSLNPRGSENSWRKAFYDEMKNDKAAFEAVADYAFDAAFRAHQSITTRERSEKISSKISKKMSLEAEQTSKEISKFIEEKIILLNQEMPNGKRLRNCTLDYLFRLGGAYRKIGERGNQSTVGSKYNETEFRLEMGGLGK